MPAAMLSFYLRSCYVENRLVRGELELAGRRLNLADVKQDISIVAAVNDHIVLWDSSYATTRFVPGGVRFVLSSGCHIAGVVNPPGPKAWYLAVGSAPDTAEKWRQAASKHAASWWEDWAVWAAERAGAMIKPPKTSSRKHPVLGDGPRDYVRA
jgi:polyhydroxyalkanoate synthase subunit PhaC